MVRSKASLPKSATSSESVSDSEARKASSPIMFMSRETRARSSISALRNGFS